MKRKMNDKLIQLYSILEQLDVALKEQMERQQTVAGFNNDSFRELITRRNSTLKAIRGIKNEADANFMKVLQSAMENIQGPNGYGDIIRLLEIKNSTKSSEKLVIIDDIMCVNADQSKEAKVLLESLDIIKPKKTRSNSKQIDGQIALDFAAINKQTVPEPTTPAKQEAKKEPVINPNDDLIKELQEYLSKTSDILEQANIKRAIKMLKTKSAKTKNVWGIGYVSSTNANLFKDLILNSSYLSAKVPQSEANKNTLKSTLETLNSLQKEALNNPESLTVKNYSVNPEDKEEAQALASTYDILKSAIDAKQVVSASDGAKVPRRHLKTYEKNAQTLARINDFKARGNASFKRVSDAKMPEFNPVISNGLFNSFTAKNEKDAYYEELGKKIFTSVNHEISKQDPEYISLQKQVLDTLKSILDKKKNQSYVLSHSTLSATIPLALMPGKPVLALMAPKKGLVNDNPLEKIVLDVMKQHDDLTDVVNESIRRILQILNTIEKRKTNDDLDSNKKYSLERKPLNIVLPETLALMPGKPVLALMPPKQIAVRQSKELMPSATISAPSRNIRDEVSAFLEAIKRPEDPELDKLIAEVKGYNIADIALPEAPKLQALPTATVKPIVEPVVELSTISKKRLEYQELYSMLEKINTTPGVPLEAINEVLDKINAITDRSNETELDQIIAEVKGYNTTTPLVDTNIPKRAGKNKEPLSLMPGKPLQALPEASKRMVISNKIEKALSKSNDESSFEDKVQIANEVLLLLKDMPKMKEDPELEQIIAEVKGYDNLDDYDSTYVPPKRYNPNNYQNEDEVFSAQIETFFQENDAFRSDSALNESIDQLIDGIAGDTTELDSIVSEVKGLIGYEPKMHPESQILLPESMLKRTYGKKTESIPTRIKNWSETRIRNIRIFWDSIMDVALEEENRLGSNPYVTRITKILELLKERAEQYFNEYNGQVDVMPGLYQRPRKDILPEIDDSLLLNVSEYEATLIKGIFKSGQLIVETQERIKKISDFIEDKTRQSYKPEYYRIEQLSIKIADCKHVIEQASTYPKGYSEIITNQNNLNIAKYERQIADIQKYIADHAQETCSNEYARVRDLQYYITCLNEQIARTQVKLYKCAKNSNDLSRAEEYRDSVMGSFGIDLSNYFDLANADTDIQELSQLDEDKLISHIKFVVDSLRILSEDTKTRTERDKISNDMNSLNSRISSLNLSRTRVYPGTRQIQVRI